MSSAGRIYSIDFLRGLVIAIMMVDHVREFFFFTVPLSDPMNLETTDPLTFFTRILAHFCAPAFIMLAGISAHLHAARHQLSNKELSAFLFKRGLFLVVLEITIINFAWTFSFPPQMLFLQVIWAIGLSMICLSALIWLPKPLLLTVAIVIISGHNMLDVVHFEPESAGYIPWAIAHDRSVFYIGEIAVRTSYPVLPWIGVIALGYVLGGLFSGSVASQDRRRKLITYAMTLTVCFVVLRAIDYYGEPNMWQQFSGDPVLTIMSFLNLTKYPPSLLFLLMTLSGGCLLLAFSEQWRGRAVDMLVTFGKVPMFFYILHLYVLHLAYRISELLWGYGWSGAPQGGALPAKLDVGSIEAVWAIACVFLVALYPAVRWFSELKARKRSVFLSYF